MIIHMDNKTGSKIAYHITDRKIEYIALAAMGYENKRIAEILCVQETAVKQMLRELFIELNGVDRASMIDNAREYGIFTNEIKHKAAAKYNITLPISYEERFAVSK